ncbi:hypothetical protein Pst134EA_000693 [Puccinia striiformis f. sp. tritici]|uniref:hypothetical protein n=1 Tax=Puccinia striiformis f. sp. tritici TaxID=168172 RepID=UPI002007F050|nr:hypothetical protein Pst134EA_000693 [Puccinia striiformis f. sp. tritici]KAH9473612.1 hypothetical protein Pst134EA_000693 [Puccinia striiformis f. sp. tritici]
MPPKKAPGSTQPREKKKSILWDRDGVNGGSSSIELVIQWLITGNNYERWRGDTEEGKSKAQFLSEINQIMIKKGILHRDAKGIRQKIADLQRSYNNACDFTKNTGEGILAEDEANGVHTVQDRILELCPYWDLLDPVMSDRSVTEPLHIRSSVGGDQPGRLMLPEDDSINTAKSNHPPLPSNTTPPLPSLGLNDDSEGSELPDIDSMFRQPPGATSQANSAPARLTTTPAPKPKAKKHRSSKRANTRASKLKKSTTEDLYMKSIVSKRQAEVTRARADASKVKVAYMKELREHGLSLEEIELKAAAEFPPLADMDHDKSDESENDSDDSA